MRERERVYVCVFVCVCAGCVCVCVCIEAIVVGAVMVASYASVLQWRGTPVRCSVLQFVVVCCSVLQCVAVCRSMLQRVAVPRVLCNKTRSYVYDKTHCETDLVGMTQSYV